MVVADDAKMADQQPVGLSIYHCAHNNQGRRVQCKCVSNVLFHFE